jgi:hypothetical protein
MVRGRREAQAQRLEGELDQRQRDRADDDRGHEIGHGRRLFGRRARKLAAAETSGPLFATWIQFVAGFGPIGADTDRLKPSGPRLWASRSKKTNRGTSTPSIWMARKRSHSGHSRKRRRRRSGRRIGQDLGDLAVGGMPYRKFAIQGSSRLTAASEFPRRRPVRNIDRRRCQGAGC